MHRSGTLHGAVDKAIFGGSIVEPEPHLGMIGAFRVFEHRQLGAKEIEQRCVISDVRSGNPIVEFNIAHESCAPFILSLCRFYTISTESAIKNRPGLLRETGPSRERTPPRALRVAQFVYSPLPESYWTDSPLCDFRQGVPLAPS